MKISQKDVLSLWTFFPHRCLGFRTFCPSGCFAFQTFCPYCRFVPRIICLRPFCPAYYVSGHYIPRRFSPDICPFGRFFSGRFVCAPSELYAAYTVERNAMDTGAYANVKKHTVILNLPCTLHFFYLKYLYNQVRL